MDERIEYVEKQATFFKKNTNFTGKFCGLGMQNFHSLKNNLNGQKKIR